MKYEVAGDPVSGLRWTRKTTKKIAAELSALGIRVSRKTVAKLLKQMNFSLRTNKKKISNGSPPTRDAQFANITQLRERFSRRGNPILSVDTKKKELVGRFKNPGRVWAQKSDAVNDHDFRSMADGVAIPYGIYDLQSNRGTVYVGTSYDTSQFAVALLHGPEQIADLPVPVAESPGAVRIGHPERSHLVEYLAPNSVFNSLPRQRSSPHLRPDDRLVTIDRVLHHASLGVA